MPKTIRAVAISNTTTSKTISNGDASSLSGVRPYIKGLIHRLGTLGYGIGNNDYYEVEYRECAAGQLAQNLGGTPDCVLCMSTTVLDAAVANVPSTIPVIGIVSTPGNYPQNNVCGISGERHQIARTYYDRLLDTVQGLQTVYILHKDQYPPSVRSLQAIQNGSHSVPIHQAPVYAPYSDVDIQNAINNISMSAGTALLMLPADSFFGAVPKIIGWAHARNFCDFWPVTDWVRTSSSGAVGGYGVPQSRTSLTFEKCEETAGYRRVKSRLLLRQGCYSDELVHYHSLSCCGA
jgi:hypothetical protein